MKNNDILSQEEIDALLSSDEETEEELSLTDEEKDVIGEVGNIVMGGASTALYNIVEKEVLITTPTVRLTSMKDMAKEHERPCIMVEVEYMAGLEGVNLLVIQEQDAAIIADLMLGGDGQNPAEEIGELHLSAVGEAMNQMMGASSTSMSQILSATIDISPPRIEHLSLEDKVKKTEALDMDQLVVAISFRMSIEDLVDSSIVMVAPVDFMKEMVQKLVDGQLSIIEDHTPGEEVEPEPEPPIQEEKPRPEKEQRRKTVASKENGLQTEEPLERTSRRRPEPDVEVQKAQFSSFDEEPADKGSSSIDILKDIPLHVTVRLGRAQMTIEEILELGKGSIIELDRLAGEDVDLLVNGKLIAKGEVVVIEENFAFRVKKIVSPMERIKDL